jgi:hypothetical protein
LSIKPSSLLVAFLQPTSKIEYQEVRFSPHGSSVTMVQPDIRPHSTAPYKEDPTGDPVSINRLSVCIFIFLILILIFFPWEIIIYYHYYYKRKKKKKKKASFQSLCQVIYISIYIYIFSTLFSRRVEDLERNQQKVHLVQLNNRPLSFFFFFFFLVFIVVGVSDILNRV